MKRKKPGPWERGGRERAAAGRISHSEWHANHTRRENSRTAKSSGKTEASLKLCGNGGRDHKTGLSSATIARVAAIDKSREAFLEARHDSSEEEEEEEEGEEGRELKSKLLEKTLSIYYQDLTQGHDSLKEKETTGMAEEKKMVVSMMGASGSCLICLSFIRRVEAVWSCGQCYCLFHLQCIQQWVKDGVRQQQQRSLLSPELFPAAAQELSWSCPKCRRDYPQALCPKTYVCFCGKQENPAVDPWLIPHSCGEMCGKPLLPKCGHHCVSLCHPGVYILPCGIHKCSRRCHYGNCEQCMQMTVKVCRCGRRDKEVPCSAEYLCESKCSKMKPCQRHHCKRKCCDGNCLPCDQVCGKTLGCRNHKCASPCHPGRCYPCVHMVDVSCRCGVSSYKVPCGREKLAKPPKCRQLCSIPPTCHHPNRAPHFCHFGRCPPCKQTCGTLLPCGHSCPSSCHSEPSTPPQRPVGVAPWVKVDSTSLKPVVKPCPPCMEMVEKNCKGGHETDQFHCSELREYSCGRSCGRSLSCGNHLCTRGCHRVIGAPDDTQAGEDCLPCERECERPRLPGCPHSCTLPCHTGECPKCDVLLKFHCHCKTICLFMKCSEWTAVAEDKKSEVQSCGNQCTKILSCGHRCSLTCHSGECLPTKDCNMRVVVKCPCRRIKKEVECCKRHTDKPTCDEYCEKVQMEEELHREQELARQEEEEKEKREREEARAARPKGRRRRKKQDQEEGEEAKQTFYQEHRTAVQRLLVAMATAALLGCFVVWVLAQ